MPLSLALLVGLVIGGLANIWGPLLGAVTVVWLPYFSEQLADVKLGGLSLTRPDVFYGAVLILIVLFAPSGLAGYVGRALRWYRSLRGAAEPAVEEVPVLEAPVDVATE